MFSANENIMLRQHKRRVIDYIESTLPEEALDKGTVVMAMQVSCREPGCVPLETAITIVFPKPPVKKKKMMKRRNVGDVPSLNTADSTQQQQVQQEEDVTPSFPKPLVPNLEASRTGGNYKTRILKPLSDVTLDDVLDALPPEFKGGRKTVESVCVRARDMMFAQIGQLIGNDNESETNGSGGELTEGRRMVAEYLKVCLEEYVERGCVPPEWGETDGCGKMTTTTATATATATTDVIGLEDMTLEESTTKTNSFDNWGEGNIVFKRPTEDEDEKNTPALATSKHQAELFNYLSSTSQRKNKKNNKPAPSTTSSSSRSNTVTSQQLLQQIIKSDHAPGIRRAGCPCCDPDAAGNYVDKMMMGGLT